MNGIAIYVEGGGNTAATRAVLRQGLTEFLAPLRDLARAKKRSFKIVLCGSRQEAFKAFED
ncbi:MAG: hypothetical protein ABW061_27360, partial [Polyangiaceae bacterium]